jgi:DNA-binding CsgD family transcriptional regulator
LTISEERKKRVIDLYYNQGKTMREIAKIERMSIHDISAIIKEEEARRLQYKHQQHQEDLSAQAYELFSQGKTPLQVAISLKIRQSVATKYYKEYWKLKRLHKLNSIYKETNGKIWIVLKLYKQLIKKKHMSIEQVINVVDIAIHKLPHMESLYKQVKDEVDKLQYTRQHLSNDIEARKNILLLLDRIAFSSEQECKRKEKQVQQLTAQKNRLEKLIANILNGEDYSKVKQIAKENVKVVLSENKKLISASFVALIQTLKADPQMINIIYRILTANDGEQQEDNNNNNAIKYLESNKDNLLDLAERNYENLVEALANNVINTAAGAASSSSNPPPSLPSSSAFLGPYNKSDTYKTEKEEMFHHSKGDIAD